MVESMSCSRSLRPLVGRFESHMQPGVIFAYAAFLEAQPSTAASCFPTLILRQSCQLGTRCCRV